MSISSPKRQNSASFSKAFCEASPHLITGSSPCVDHYFSFLCGFTIYVSAPNLLCGYTCFKPCIHRILLYVLLYYLTPPLSIGVRFIRDAPWGCGRFFVFLLYIEPLSRTVSSHCFQSCWGCFWKVLSDYRRLLPMDFCIVTDAGQRTQGLMQVSTTGLQSQHTVSG